MWSNRGDITTQNEENKEVPWLFVTLAKGVSTFAGLVAAFFGVWSLFSFDYKCIFSAVVLIVEGLIVTWIEAPWAFSMIDFSYSPNKFFENKTHWWKAVIYLMFAMIPFMFCDNFSNMFGCGLLVIASASYLVLSLGKKASLEEMRSKATVSENPHAVLVNNEQSVDRSTLFTPPTVPPQFNDVKLNPPFTSPTERPVY